MSDDTSNRPSRGAERPYDVTDPLLWQLAIDVLSAHEPDDEGHCRNLQCTGRAWPCAARQGAEHSLRLSRGASDSVESTVGGVDAGTDSAPASRWGHYAGPVASRRTPKASASAA